MAHIVWWEIETPNPLAFQQFHAAMWGWAFESAFAGSEIGADYWIIQSEGQGIGGLQAAAEHTAPPSVGSRVYVSVDDLEDALQKAEHLGARVERRRTELGGNDRWFATICDPTGVSIGLWTEHAAR